MIVFTQESQNLFTVSDVNKQDRKSSVASDYTTHSLILRFTISKLANTSSTSNYLLLMQNIPSKNITIIRYRILIYVYEMINDIEKYVQSKEFEEH